MESQTAELSPLHMIRKKAFRYPRCGVLAYHAAETPDDVLSDVKSSLVSADEPLSQVVLLLLLYANVCGNYW